MAEMDILGVVAVVAMAMAGMVDALADTDVVTIATTTTPTKPNLMHADVILWQNGTNFLLKSVTRFGRSISRKANPVKPNISLVTSLLNKSQPSLAPCNKCRQQLTSKRLSSLPKLRWETLLAAK